MRKNYDLYSPYQRTIDNLKRRIRGYEKMKKDLTNQYRKSNKENQELKKQLNSDDWINSIKETERHYIYSIENENEKLKKRLETKETQQKEFIEYLEDYIDALKQQKETVAELDISEVYSLMILEEVLEKYKEIIEVDN